MASVTVGSFAKSASSGAFTQDVAHGGSETPKALILWMTAATVSGTFIGSAFPSIGFVDSDRLGIALGAGIGTGRTRRISDDALVVVNTTDGTVVGRANISAWDDTEFTMSWEADTTSANTWRIGFMAIFGSEVSSQVVNHALDGDTGADPITGAGFEPSLALMLFGGNLAGAMPVAAADFAPWSIGAANATDQWCMGVSCESPGTSDTRRAQRTDNCLLSVAESSDAFTWLAAFSSFDSDGMTLNVTTAGTAASHLGVLFLSGIGSEIGFFTKDNSGDDPSTDTISGFGLNPDALLLASFQSSATTSVVQEARFGLGFSDGSTDFSGAMTDEDAQATEDVASVIKTDKAFLHVNNDTDTITAEADVTLKTRAADVVWSTNDTDETQMLYLALGNTLGGGSGGGGGQGGGGGKGGGGGGGGNPGGPPGGGPPGQGNRRTIVGQQRRHRRGLVGLF